MPELVHGKYLPFRWDELSHHFADVASGGDPDRHLAYYRESVADAAYRDQMVGKSLKGPPVTASRGLQMQRDERFWVVAALMAVVHSPDRIAGLAALLSRCFGKIPPFPGAVTWSETLGADPQLFFEVNLPSPKSYRAYLARNLDERVLIPHLRRSAATQGARLEGATKVDAMIVSADTGFAVLFEAKALSDLSITVRYDVLRNQLARNIDVMLESNPELSLPLNARSPERTCLALITPEVFRTHPSSRLYGWLMPRYQNPDGELLAEHLPHRTPDERAGVGARLGWLTWEDIDDLHPGACSWLLPR